MFLYLFILFSYVTASVASDSSSEKCFIRIPIGTQLEGKFIESSTSKIKLSTTCTLQELQTWLCIKHGAGALYFCNTRALFMPSIATGLQNSEPMGKFVMSNFSIPLPSEEEVENAYTAVIPTYAQHSIEDLRSPVEIEGEDTDQDLKFRFVFNKN